MRVLLFEIWKHGGTAEYASNLLKALAESEATKRSVILAGPRGLAGASESMALPDLTGGPSPSKPVRAARYGLQWARQQFSIIDAIRKTRPDVAHFLGTAVASPAVYAFCKIVGVKTVVTVHDLPVKNKETPIGLRVTSSGFEKADRILAHGEWTRNAIGEQLGESAKSRTEVIPFGIAELPRSQRSRDEIRAQHRIPPDARVALFFGSVRANKGLDILLESFNKIGDDRLWLVVAGQSAGRSEATVESYGQNLDSEARKRIIWITEFIPDEQIPEMFAMSDVLVMPYRASFASQSAVLGMAIAAGTPVIASNVGEIGPTVSKYKLGALVTPESVGVLTQALEDFVNGRFNFGAGGFAEAKEQMSWYSAAAAHWREYETLVATRRQSGDAA